MIKNQQFRSIVGSLGVPLVAFWSYSSVFFGDYAGTDMLWGVVVSVAFALAIYLYFPTAKKVERGSLIWFLGLFAIICLFALGVVLSGFGTHYILMIPAAEQAWGNYMLSSAFGIPAIHMGAKAQEKGQDKLREITPREILLFKGPATWNKAKK